MPRRTSPERAKDARPAGCWGVVGYPRGENENVGIDPHMLICVVVILIGWHTRFSVLFP